MKRAAGIALPLVVLAILLGITTAHGQSAVVVAAHLGLRMLFSLLLTLLLVLTTRFRDLMRGLRGIGIPAIFVAVLERTYQHLYHLPLIASEMLQARRSRTVGKAVNRGEARRYIGFSLGALLGKTHALAEATHAAMVARGFGGAPIVSQGGNRLAWQDGVFMLASVAVAVLLFWWDSRL